MLRTHPVYAVIGTHMQISEKRVTCQNQLNANKNIYIALYTWDAHQYLVYHLSALIGREFDKLVEISFRVLIIICIEVNISSSSL